MEPDELFSKRSDDPVALVVRQDIDRLSVEDLEARIAALEGEIVRCRSRITAAVNHRATADSLFKK